MQGPFQPLNEYYDHIYVLSVEAAVERRALFSSRFTGLHYQFFFGADKNNFSVSDAEARGVFSESLTRRHHRFGKTMKHGEIACSWSHKMMYEDMLAKNFNRVLILEDDAVPGTSRLEDIPKILSEIPDDAELLMWGWDKNGVAAPWGGLKKILYHLQHRVGKLKWDHTMIKNLYAKPYSGNLKIAGFHDYTYAYAINRDAASKLSTMQTPIQYIADNLLAHAVTKELVRGYIVDPPVFLHDSLPDGTHRDSYIR